MDDSIRTMWAAGDYAKFGDLFARVGRDLVDDVGVAGHDVLDVATGTGNTAIAAARAGGRVTGVDITPELLDVARARAHAAGMEVTWVVGDMRNLPVADATFDRVLSTFGAMFAADPPAMAAELVRVCRPGGTIATTAWSADSAFSRIGEIVGRYFPVPDADSDAQPATDPADWARPGIVTGFFASQPVTVRTTTRVVPVRWASSAEAVDGMAAHCGPFIGAVDALREMGHWPAARLEIMAMLDTENAAPDGSLVVEMPYVVTRVTRQA